VQGDRREAGWLLWQSVTYLGRVLRAELEPILRDVGMGSPVEVWVCALVERRGPQRLVDVARAIHLPASTLSDLTERLVADGFLARSPNPRDRRSAVLAVTDRGREALRRLHDAVAARLEAVLADLDAATVQHLVAGLRALAQALEARDPSRTPPGPPDAARPS
jgi:DNA-binding MarR family transcriptional regulator